MKTMNKKNFIYVAALSMGLLVTGCSDQFLQDKKQYGVYDENSFQSETQVGWYVDRLYFDFYSAFRGPGQNIVGLWEDRTALTEEKGGISNLIDPAKEFETSDDCSQYYGIAPGTSLVNNPYTRIRNCNTLLLNIDEQGTNVSADFKKTAKGQAYYLRAMQYFDLVRMYGGVPIVLTVDDPSAENAAIKYPRATTSACIGQILSDFDQAATLLPDKWNSANQGRFTRAAALAMKSRVLLTFASPLFNKNWDNSTDKRWEDALQAGLTAERELTAAGYGLYGNNAKDWNDMFVLNHGSTFCKEAIVVRLLSPATSVAENNGWENSIRVKSQSGDGGVTAPKQMVDLFPMKDGSRPTTVNGYDDFKFFLNRDPRFYRTFAFSGSKWGYKGNADATIWLYRWKYKDGKGNEVYGNSDSNDKSCPAIIRKMSDTSVENTFKYSGTDIIEYRYAELLLNIAECYAAQGNTGKCLEYLKQIRRRVGIPEANNYGLGTFADKYAAIEACLYERRVELAYEGKRALDISRWMLYNDDSTPGNNTCAKLGVTPLNGTSRIGKTLEYKELVTNTDPLLSKRPGVKAIDPDAATFETDLTNLATFYADNFVVTDPDTPMDNDGKGKEVKIDWKQRYYVWGLHRNPLVSNTWLTQTKGWKDANGAEGTFDFQE